MENSLTGLCDHNRLEFFENNPPTSQTDGRTTCDRNAALCTKVHRAVKTGCIARFPCDSTAFLFNQPIKQQINLLTGYFPFG